MKEPQKIHRPGNSILHNEESVSSTIIEHNKQGLMKNFMSSIMSGIKHKMSPFFPIIRNVWRLRLNVWIIKGEEKTTKQEIKLLYMGSDLSKHYLEDLIFSNIIEEKYIGKRWIWTTLRMARSNCADYSLLIAETGDYLAKIFKRKREYFVPCWIVAEIDLNSDSSDPAQMDKNKNLKADIHRIKKHELDYELTKSQAQFNKFYHDMYKPFAVKRYGKKAIVEKYYDLRISFKKGELILVKMGGIPVAGTLIKYEKNQAFLHVLGVKDGDSDYLRFGAISALYYYSIRYLKGRGFTRLNMGATRPFLMDGVLLYKKKWGLKIIGTTGPGFLMKLLSETAAVRGFLSNNPFIYKDSKHIYGAVFLLPEQVDDKRSVEKTFHDYYIDGMSKLLIYVFDSADSIAQMDMPNKLEDKITILRAGEIL